MSSEPVQLHWVQQPKEVERLYCGLVKSVYDPDALDDWGFVELGFENREVEVLEARSTQGTHGVAFGFLYPQSGACLLSCLSVYEHSRKRGIGSGLALESTRIWNEQGLNVFAELPRDEIDRSRLLLAMGAKVVIDDLKTVSEDASDCSLVALGTVREGALRAFLNDYLPNEGYSE